MVGLKMVELVGVLSPRAHVRVLSFNSFQYLIGPGKLGVARVSGRVGGLKPIDRWALTHKMVGLNPYGRWA